MTLLQLFSQVLKMQSMIQFPLYDFDLSDYVPFEQRGMTYKYDLFGIVVSDESAVHL